MEQYNPKERFIYYKIAIAVQIILLICSLVMAIKDDFVLAVKKIEHKQQVALEKKQQIALEEERKQQAVWEKERLAAENKRLVAQEKEQQEKQKKFMAAAKASISSFTDTRDGKKYKYVKIGEQTWMAENLNYATSNSKCYDNKQENCQKYGALYNWNEATKACPTGWHLPTVDEWSGLKANIGYNRSKYLKSAKGWNNNGNGTDDYGFSALPGGGGRSNGSFYDVGSFGYWWGASSNPYGAYYYRISYDNDLEGISEDGLLSVRCVKD
jgi:uncharacterized protein (TIGR02145 family)